MIAQILVGACIYFVISVIGSVTRKRFGSFGMHKDMHHCRTCCKDLWIFCVIGATVNERVPHRSMNGLVLCHPLRVPLLVLDDFLGSSSCRSEPGKVQLCTVVVEYPSHECSRTTTHPISSPSKMSLGGAPQKENSCLPPSCILEWFFGMPRDRVFHLESRSEEVIAWAIPCPLRNTPLPPFPSYWDEMKAIESLGDIYWQSISRSTLMKIRGSD